MSILNKQPGWNNTTKLLWDIASNTKKLAKSFLNGFIIIPDETATKGTTAYRLISTASVNLTVVKASKGNLYSISAISIADEITYLKLYNLNVEPTVNDIPLMTIPIPTNAAGAGVVIPFLIGVNFTNGISFKITKNVADNDNTPIEANNVILNLTYA